MIDIVGNDTTVQYWPGAQMSRFGLNPYGEPLYRVVWSDSRMELLGGIWGDNQRPEYRWIPRYEEHCWILEKWLSPIEFAGTPATWEATTRDAATWMLTLGPYPSRGEYERCFSFDAFPPSVGAIERIIGLISRSQDTPAWAKKAALVQKHEDKKQDFMQRGRDLWDDSRPFHITEKQHNSVKFNHAVEDLRMPVGDGKFFGGKRNGR